MACQRSIRLPNQDTGHYPIVACSTTFAHNSNIVPDPPDLILVSSDGVHFYVHSQQLLGESANQLNSLLSPEGEHDYNRLITLPEPSTVVNVILHTMYGISCTPYHPSALTVIAAITALPKYGVTLKQCIVPGMPLYATALESLPCEPIEFYTLAAEHELHPLAVEASTHMGDFSIMSIPDEQVERMGVMYYKKLVAMAEGRADMVKRLTRAQPEAHPPTPSCTEEDQQLMRTSWTILVSEFAWDRLRCPRSSVLSFCS